MYQRYWTTRGKDYNMCECFSFVCKTFVQGLKVYVLSHYVLETDTDSTVHRKCSTVFNKIMSKMNHCTQNLYFFIYTIKLWDQN